MCVTVPLVLKPRLSWLMAWRLPLPETVDCTTPCATVAVRVRVAWLPAAGPTTRIAAATAPAQRIPSAYTSQDALVGSAFISLPTYWVEPVRAGEERPQAGLNSRKAMPRPASGGERPNTPRAPGAAWGVCDDPVRMAILGGIDLGG